MRPVVLVGWFFSAVVEDQNLSKVGFCWVSVIKGERGKGVEHLEGKGHGHGLWAAEKR